MSLRTCVNLLGPIPLPGTFARLVYDDTLLILRQQQAPTNWPSAPSYYFDAVAGVDANPGTIAAPKQTLTALQNIVAAYTAGAQTGLNLLLKCATEWSAEVAGMVTIPNLAGGGSIALSSYGTGDNPHINYADRSFMAGAGTWTASGNAFSTLCPAAVGDIYLLGQESVPFAWAGSLANVVASSSASWYWYQGAGAGTAQVDKAGITATASASSGGNPASNTIDNGPLNAGSQWAAGSAGTGVTIKWDLGADTSITRLDWMGGDQHIASFTAGTGVVEVATAALPNTWVQVGTWDVNSNFSHFFEDTALGHSITFAPTTARYIRLRGTGDSVFGSDWSILEVYIFKTVNDPSMLFANPGTLGSLLTSGTIKAIPPASGVGHGFTLGDGDANRWHAIDVTGGGICLPGNNTNHFYGGHAAAYVDNCQGISGSRFRRSGYTGAGSGANGTGGYHFYLNNTTDFFQPSDTGLGAGGHAVTVFGGGGHERMLIGHHWKGGPLPGINAAASIVGDHPAITMTYLLERDCVVDGGPFGHHTATSYAGPSGTVGTGNAALCVAVIYGRKIGTFANPMLMHSDNGGIGLIADGVYQSGLDAYLVAASSSTGQAQINAPSTAGVGWLVNSRINLWPNANNSPSIVFGGTTNEFHYNNQVVFNVPASGFGSSRYTVNAYSGGSPIGVRVFNCIIERVGTNGTWWVILDLCNNRLADDTTVVTPSVNDGLMFVGVSQDGSIVSDSGHEGTAHVTHVVTTPGTAPATTQNYLTAANRASYLVPSGGLAGVNLVEDDIRRKARGSTIYVGPYGGVDDSGGATKTPEGKWLPWLQPTLG